MHRGEENGPSASPRRGTGATRASRRRPLSRVTHQQSAGEGKEGGRVTKADAASSSSSSRRNAGSSRGASAAGGGVAVSSEEDLKRKLERATSKLPKETAETRKSKFQDVVDALDLLAGLAQGNAMEDYKKTLSTALTKLAGTLSVQVRPERVASKDRMSRLWDGDDKYRCLSDLVAGDRGWGC